MHFSQLERRSRPGRRLSSGETVGADRSGAGPRRGVDDGGEGFVPGSTAGGDEGRACSRILVWDVATRVLHAAIAMAVTAALVIGLTTDEGDALFGLHMIAGLAAGFFILLRIALGVLGSRYSRFGSWSLAPVELGRYLTGVVTGRAKRYVGHNPGTSWMSLMLFLMVGLLVVTGLSGEAGEDVHEVAAYVVLALIVLHLLGLALHTWRRRENIAWSMIDGRKAGPPEAALPSNRLPLGLTVAGIAVAGALVLYRGFDARSGQLWLPFRDAPVQLGEAGGDEESHSDDDEGSGQHGD